MVLSKSKKKGRYEHVNKQTGKFCLKIISFWVYSKLLIYAVITSIRNSSLNPLPLQDVPRQGQGGEVRSRRKKQEVSTVVT